MSMRFTRSSLEAKLNEHARWLEADGARGSRLTVRGVDLRDVGVVFDGMDLSQAMMASCNLAGLSFKGANLSETNFYQSNLVDADFSNANLTRAFLDSAKLKGASFLGATVTGATLTVSEDLPLARHLPPCYVSLGDACLFNREPCLLIGEVPGVSISLLGADGVVFKQFWYKKFTHVKPLR